MSVGFSRYVVSVPGKLILMGEHAAVYGKPALVAAADPRARVEVERAAHGIAVVLADLGLEVETTWEEAKAHAERSRRAWEGYAAAPTPDRFAEVGARSPGHLVQVALGEIASGADDSELPGLSMRVTSQLPIGSGFGSSAAIAVAIIGAIQGLVRGRIDRPGVDRLALEVERRQHGLPSGVDHKTVLYGGVVLAERQETGALEVHAIEAGSRILSRLEVLQTGQPAETTGEVVAAVRRRRDDEGPLFDERLDRMGHLAEAFARELTDPNDRGERITQLIRGFEASLEELGVVPASVRESIRKVEAAGGAAKISGAGALTGTSAGCLLVYWPDGPPSETATGLDRYQVQAVELGADGLRTEERE